MYKPLIKRTTEEIKMFRSDANKELFNLQRVSDVAKINF